MNLRALLVTVVAPSRRPVTLCYWGRMKQRGERTLRGKDFFHSKGVTSFNTVTGNINSPSTRVDNNHVVPNLQTV